MSELASALAVSIPIVAIAGGMAVAGIALINERHRARLRSDERRLMIEKGMVPPTDLEPQDGAPPGTPAQMRAAIESCLRNGLRMFFLALGLGLAYFLLRYQDTWPDKISPTFGIAALVVGFLGLGNIVYYVVARRRLEPGLLDSPR